MKNIKRILLVSTGRSGTTLLMKILSAHPDVLVRTVFPFETRAMQFFYLSNLQGNRFADYQPLAEGNFTYDPCQKNDEQSKLWWDAHPRIPLGVSGTNASDSYYKMVSYLENKPNFTHVAEKAVGWSTAQSILKDIDDTTIISLFRDPRDVFFSIKSFNRKRGSLSFGEEFGDDFLMKTIVNFYCYAERQIASNPQRIFKVRYEGIIKGPDTSIKRLFDILGLPSDENIVMRAKSLAFENNSNVNAHKTIESSIDNSVSRWKYEVNEDTAKLFNIYEDKLEMIGYKVN